MSQPPPYTAAQIAKALGVTPRAVRLRLVAVAAPGVVTVRGQKAEAWPIAVLPPIGRADLAAIAQTRGVAIEELLSDPPAPWTAPLPWHSVAKSEQETALKLSAALAPALALQHELSGPDLMELAAAHYRQHFGAEIAADKLRYVMDRATKRDNGLMNFTRPEIYLSDRAFHPVAQPSMKSNNHAALEDALSHVVDKNAPSMEDKAYLLHAAFLQFETLASASPSSGELRTAKNSIVQHLYQNCPGLYCPQTASLGESDHSKPLLALRSLFNRMLPLWIAGGRTASAVMDQRIRNSGRKGYKHAECERKVLGFAARLRGKRGKAGILDLSVKTLSEKGEICEQCQWHFHPDRISSKARSRLTPNALQVAYFKDADAVRKISPTHHNHWQDTPPGCRFVVDDMTTCEIAWDSVNGQIISGPAQMLYTEDECSAYPLPFLLYFGHPNSHTIKKEIALVLKTVGLPHEALVTERGVFANRQLAGERGVQNHLDFRAIQSAMERHFQFAALDDDTLQSIRRKELGFRDPAFRLSITQARSPQAKTVERTFYNFQQSASRLPGHVGFNQRNEMSRAMQDFDRRVKIGKEHPGNEYLHLSDLRKNYERIADEIAHRPVNGIRHRGLTPAQLWAQGLAERPLRKLPPEIEALLATHRLPAIRVRPQGIAIVLDKHETAFYFNAATGPHVGRDVAVLINYDSPEYIHMEHPATGLLMKVERAHTARRTATPEELAKVNQARKDHVRGALAEIGQIPNPITSYIIRDHEHAPRDLEAGAQIAADAAEHQVTTAKSKREMNALKIKAGALGVSVSTEIRNPERVRQGLEAAESAMREIEEMERENKEKLP